MDLVSLGSSVEEEDSPLVFLEQVHMFRERVEEFIKAPLPSVINLSVTPRAAEHLQQHWPAVTIGSLEEAPVPKVCCCSRCGAAEACAPADGEGRDRIDGRAQHRLRELLLPLGLLLLLLLAAAAWAEPVGFPLLSQSSQLVHGLSSELMTSVCETAGSAYAVLQVAVDGWSSRLCSVGEELDALFKSLTSH